MDQSDRWQPWTSRRSEAEDTRRDRKACVEAKQGAVLSCPFDEENHKFLKLPSRGVYQLKVIVVIATSPGPDIYWRLVGDGSYLAESRVFICSLSFLIFPS